MAYEYHHVFEYYDHFVGYCGAFHGLKRILALNNEKMSN